MAYFNKAAYHHASEWMRSTLTRSSSEFLTPCCGAVNVDALVAAYIAAWGGSDQPSEELRKAAADAHDWWQRV